MSPKVANNLVGSYSSPSFLSLDPSEEVVGGRTKAANGEERGEEGGEIKGC